jgi:hypothetical protein
MAIHVPINLASEPFRRDRPMMVGSAVLAGLLLFLLVIQGVTVVSQRHQAADTRQLIDRLNAQLKTLSTDQTKLNATLRLGENSEVLERSVFLNSLIDRKAISWTKIFADLEKVMPYNVRLVNVRLPEVDAKNNVLLDMVVGAKEVAPVIQLLNKFEAAPQFGPTDLQNQMPPSQTEPMWRFHVVVTYAQKL